MPPSDVPWQRRSRPHGPRPSPLAAPAHDVLCVESTAVGGDGKREQLIPFVEPIVKGVDLGNRTVTVEWEADY